MNRTLRFTLAGAAASAVVLGGAGAALGAVSGSGASFPNTAYSKWCQESGLCSYSSKGSTGGINDFINGVVDFAATDAPLTSEQLGQLASKRGGVKPLYFPTLVGAISVSTNIDGLDRGINLDGPVLADIFRGAITTWNHPSIRRANPGVRLPGAPITLCVRADGSGTSFGFTSYLSKVSRAFRSQIGAQQLPNWPSSGVTVVKGPRNPGVAQCIKANNNAIGYVDISDARDAGLTRFFTKIGKSEVVGKGKNRKRVTRYIAPSPGASSKAGNLKTFPKDLTVSLTASPAPGAYPITITTWVIAYSNASAAGRSGTAPEVKKMLNYFYSPKAQGQLNSLRFAPLPKSLLDAAKKQLAQVR